MLGRWGSAQRAAARVVEATATYSSWQRGQPRMLAVAVGTQAALEMGDGKKALGFLSSVLKYDPDQSEVRSQYKRLKEVLKLMESAEAQLVKGYNHRAVKELEGVLAKLRGMDVGNTLFRAQVRSRPLSRIPAPSPTFSRPLPPSLAFSHLPSPSPTFHRPGAAQAVPCALGDEQARRGDGGLPDRPPRPDRGRARHPRAPGTRARGP